jgi:hypothetical protein
MRIELFDLKVHVEKRYQLVACFPTRIEGDFGKNRGQPYGCALRINILVQNAQKETFSSDG